MSHAPSQPVRPVTCPVCDSVNTTFFLERRSVPVHQNLPLDSPDAARAARRGDLTLWCCLECGFITNTTFDAALLEYGSQYENDQTFSEHFAAHVEALVSRVTRRGVRGRRVVEVGCGSGAFLRRLCIVGSNEGIGYDPSYRGPAADDTGQIRFLPRFYGPAEQHVRPDAVICRHVIEHVHQPLSLLRSIRVALGGVEDALVFFETPCIRWILDGVVLQDFFYEHCSYFSSRSLAVAFLRSGFSSPEIDHVFGGQYLWLEATTRPNSSAFAAAHSPAETEALLVRYREAESARLARLSSFIDSLHSTGRVAVWGAGAKGVTFLNLLDPDASRVACVVDINPRKHGRFVPGTAHPIIAPTQLLAFGISDVIVMNPNYGPEIRASAATLERPIRIHSEGDL